MLLYWKNNNKYWLQEIYYDVLGCLSLHINIPAFYDTAYKLMLNHLRMFDIDNKYYMQKCCYLPSIFEAFLEKHLPEY